MTLADLPSTSFTGAELSARLNAALAEVRPARRFRSVSELLSDAIMAYGTGARPVEAGQRIQTACGHVYDVVAAGATDHHVITAGGVRLQVVTAQGGWLPATAFGVNSANPAAVNTACGQMAIDVAQALGCKLRLPAGTIDTNGWTYSGDLPLCVEGQGAIPIRATMTRRATVLRLMQANGALFTRASGANTALKVWRDFSCLNGSGGSAEAAFLSTSGAFCRWENVTGAGFAWGIRHQWSLYCSLRDVFFRQGGTGFDFTNIDQTGPFTLNSIAAGGYFANAIAFDNCGALDCNVGFDLAGVTINATVLDVERCATAGVRLGSSSFPVTMATIQQIYGESDTTMGTLVAAANANLSLGQVFWGKGTCTYALDVSNSTVVCDFLRSYATISTGVRAQSGSRVTVDDYAGTIGTGGSFQKWSASGGAKVRFLKDEDTNTTAGDIVSPVHPNYSATPTGAQRNSFQDVKLEIPQTGTGNIYDVVVTGKDNGSTDFTMTVRVSGRTVAVVGTKPANLTVALSPVNGNGNHDLRISCGVGFAYGFSFTAKPIVIDTVVPIPAHI